MPESMSISVNGQSQVPPGFRFHPTEEELLQYYLRKKVSFEKIDLDVILEVDLNKLEPWDIQERCKIGTTPQNDWYFFSHKDKKYPTGTRTNRATVAGFWKATGRDKVICSNCRRIGMRKTLVFYKGRAPHGQKSDWIMHEYRLDDNINDSEVSNNAFGDETKEDGWVVCRIFKKKNHHKTLDSPLCSSSLAAEPRSHMYASSNEGSLEQILHYSMGRSTHHEDHETNNTSKFLRPVMNFHDTFMKLPTLESPNSTSSHHCYPPLTEENEASIANFNHVNREMTYNYTSDTGLASWATFDRLVASQLNGQTIGYGGGEHDGHLQLPTVRSSLSNSSDVDLWNLTRPSTSSSLSSSSNVDPFCHVVNASV